MAQKQVKPWNVILARYGELLADLEPRSILDAFVSEEFMPYCSCRDIMDTPIDTNKNRAILEYLRIVDNNKYRRFLNILRKTCQTHVADMLEDVRRRMERGEDVTQDGRRERPKRQLPGAEERKRALKQLPQYNSGNTVPVSRPRHSAEVCQPTQTQQPEQPKRRHREQELWQPDPEFWPEQESTREAQIDEMNSGSTDIPPLENGSTELPPLDDSSENYVNPDLVSTVEQMNLGSAECEDEDDMNLGSAECEDEDDRADIVGTKSNADMNNWLPRDYQAGDFTAAVPNNKLRIFDVNKIFPL